MAFVVSVLIGSLYSILIGLVSGPVRTPLIVWPLLTLSLWYAFRKFNLIRLAGFFAILPVSVLSFEIVRTVAYPSAYSFRYLAIDRSHYMPGVRVNRRQDIPRDPLNPDRGVMEILIGNDGFRVDPETGRGNSERCSIALIGDSMIYGSGLPYSETLRPALAAIGIDACVFGVTGNTPIDYLATLKHVANRLETEAHVVVYLYAYNDFVGLSKYLRRRLRALSNAFEPLTRLIVYYDDWRRTTFTHSLYRGDSGNSGSPLTPWEVRIGEEKRLSFHYRGDPALYAPPPPLDKGQRAALKVFFRRLRDLTHDKSWRVSIVVIPDNAEVMANLAREFPIFQDLDPRRRDALAICQKFSVGCKDLTKYLYERTLAEGKNPYLIGDRHFSSFGTRVVAQHFLAITKWESDDMLWTETQLHFGDTG